MTMIEVLFIVEGAFAVLSVTMWAKYNAAYKQLDYTTVRERRFQEQHIDSLKAEVTFWRSHFDAKAAEYTHDNT